MTDPVLMHARDDGIAIITINRPEQRNCLSKEVREALFAAWDWFENDPAMRVAILIAHNLMRTVALAPRLLGLASPVAAGLSP